MTRERLLDVERVAKRQGTTTALVPTDGTICGNCTATLITVQATQPALFRHGGYGENKRGTVNVCATCGWVGGRRQESTNPREREHKA